MGIFRFAAGGNKLDLIKQLLISRIENDLAATRAGLTPFAVRQLSDLDLLASTEALIVTIVETYQKLCSQGLSDDSIIEKIEAGRKSLGDRGVPPKILSLFIRHRVDIEHQGPELPYGHLELCIDAATHLFAYLDDKGEGAHSVKYAKLQAIERRYEHVMDALAEHFGMGISTEDEFFDLIQQPIQSWIPILEAKRKKHAQGKFIGMLRELDE